MFQPCAQCRTSFSVQAAGQSLCPHCRLKQPLLSAPPPSPNRSRSSSDVSCKEVPLPPSPEEAELQIQSHCDAQSHDLLPPPGPPRRQSDHAENDNLCTICLVSLEEFPCRTLEPCKHKFHAGCINHWLNISDSNGCPMCRQAPGQPLGHLPFTGTQKQQLCMPTLLVGLVGTLAGLGGTAVAGAQVSPAVMSSCTITSIGAPAAVCLGATSAYAYYCYQRRHFRRHQRFWWNSCVNYWS